MAATAIAAALLAGTPAAQAPSLNDVLRRAAAYVAEFRKQLSGIVSEETYRQEISYLGRIGGGNGEVRTLRSDLLLVRPAESDRYVELRDVFEVDGNPVRDRGARLETLLRDPKGGAAIGAIINESARYNIGRVTRNINTPLMALQFLDAANQHRFTFRHIATPSPVFREKGDQAANEAPVFRVSTEMWTVEYRERRDNTIVKRPDGRDMPSHGRFWINPANGSVLISELVVEGGSVVATVTVSYQSEPLMGFLVPVEMREIYVGTGSRPERIAGSAVYGKFRPIAK